MAVDPKELRLRAAQLGSRLKVQNVAQLLVTAPLGIIKEVVQTAPRPGRKLEIRRVFST